MDPRHLCSEHRRVFSECIGTMELAAQRGNLLTECIHEGGHSMQDLILKIYAAVNFALDRTEGQNMVEYAMAVGLIAFGCIAGEAAIATGVNRVFIALGTAILNGVGQ